jgi:hypothetical protein
MQAYVQQKKSPSLEKDRSEAVKVSKIKTKSAGELSGKFKLASWSRKKSKKLSSEVVVKDDKSHDGTPRMVNQALMLYAVRGGLV